MFDRSLQSTLAIETGIEIGQRQTGTSRLDLGTVGISAIHDQTCIVTTTEAETTRNRIHR